MRTLLAIAAALPLLGLSAATRAEDATRLLLDYEVYAGGIKGLDFSYRLELNREQYSTELKAEISGAYGWLFEFWLNSEAEGLLTGAGVAPQSYLNRSQWSDRPERSIVIDFENDGRVESEVRPTRQDDDRPEVPQELRAGSLDPLSAILSISQAIAETGRCDAEAPVFDGRRRFNVLARDEGEETIEANDYQVYAGPARRCRFSFQPVAGFKADDGGQGNPEDKRYSEETVLVFLATLAEGLPPVPVRMEADHRLGALRAHLARFERGS